MIMGEAGTAFEDVRPAPTALPLARLRDFLLEARRRPLAAAALVAIWILATTIAVSSVTGVGPLFWSDSVNHLWIVSALDEPGLLPTLTVSGTRTGQLYPVLAFYGGTLYWVTNLVGRLLGSFEFAYDLSILVSFAAAYLGAFWFARQLGLRFLLANLSGLALLACPYLLTNVFGRGAWPEFVATSWIPMLIGSIAATAMRPRKWTIVVVIVSSAAVSGSHVITLVYGLAFVAAVLIAVAIVDHTWFRRTTGLAYASTAFALGIVVNAWWIAPLLRYGSSTVIGSKRWFAFDMEFTQFRFVLSPFLSVPDSSTTPHLHANAPVWILAATVAGIVVTSWTGQLRVRTATVLTAGLIVLISLGSINSLWRHVPEVMRLIQFPYRTLTYTNLWVVGCWVVLMAALRKPGRRSNPDLTRLMGVLLVAAVALQTCFAIVQIADSHRDALEFERELATESATPSTFYSWADYRFIGGSTPFARSIDTATVCAKGRCVISGMKPGEPTQISVPDTPFVHVLPESSYVGRSKDNLLVVAAGPSGSVTVERTRPPLARYGLVISLLAIMATVLLVVAVPSRRQIRSG